MTIIDLKSYNIYIYIYLFIYLFMYTVYVLHCYIHTIATNCVTVQNIPSVFVSRHRDDKRLGSLAGTNHTRIFQLDPSRELRAFVSLNSGEEFCS